MKRIVLLSCVSKKLPHKAKARELYISPLFKYSLKYAISLKPDKIYVLSAKYGLLDLDNEIGPYDETLNSMSKIQVKEWSDKVIQQMKLNFDLDDEVIFLAGQRYRKFLLPQLKNYKIPLGGLGIGKQLRFLKENG